MAPATYTEALAGTYERKGTSDAIEHHFYE